VVRQPPCVPHRLLPTLLYSLLTFRNPLCLVVEIPWSSNKFWTSSSRISLSWSCIVSFTERALKLSATCLKLNPANYTVWHYRRECLNSLGLSSNKASVQKDLDLASALGGGNPKNYQVRIPSIEDESERSFISFKIWK
jgi:Protein prenyltransferase alpha subunit repeat